MDNLSGSPDGLAVVSDDLLMGRDDLSIAWYRLWVGVDDSVVALDGL